MIYTRIFLGFVITLILLFLCGVVIPFLLQQRDTIGFLSGVALIALVLFALVCGAVSILLKALQPKSKRKSR
jgi:multisubunit Na+/H+ antiporter MnhE subunit